MSSSPHFGTGQTHLNSDAKIADEGRPQGAPLPIVFSRRYALGRAPTRGAPTDCLLSALCPGEGTHKGRPYQLPSLGVMPWGGHPQGAPLPIAFSRRYALGRAPTRGAPTNCLLSALCPGEGTHKGRPYQLPSLGVMPWGGHPQGAPLPIAFSRRYALGRAPTRGAPTDCLLSALCPGEGTHKGRPYRLFSFGVMAGEGRPQGAPLPIVFFRRYGRGRAPTRGAPTDCLFSALWPGEGAHKGRPYRLFSFGVMAGGGHPQGAPLPIAFSRRYALGRAPTRGAPTDCFLSALWPGKGAHKGRPYQLSFFGVMPWGGHPQGALLPIAFSRRYALGRAPTRGAPTNCLLLALCPGEGTHKGRPYQLSFFGVMAGGGHPQGAPLPIVFSRRYGLGRAPTRGAPTDCFLSALWPGEGTHKGRPYRLFSFGVMPWGGHPQGAPLPIAFSRRYGLGRAPTRGAPTNCLLSALCPGKGTHKGRPYRFAALGRAPTRGAPTRFRQPHVGLSQFDAIALHFGMHPAAMGRARAQFGSPRSCCKGNCRRSKDGTDLSVFVPERKAKAHRGHEG